MIRGVDVSWFQQQVDWPQLVKSGDGGFGYGRCTEGLSPDKMHDVHMTKARASGVPFGSYQYGHPLTQDPEASADFFLARATLVELAPVVDMESLRAGKFIPPNAGEWADRWCERIKRMTGIVNPMIYASPGYYLEMRRQRPQIAGPTGWPWWNADYTGTPNQPKTINFGSGPIDLPPYVAHQFAGDVKLLGIVGLADRDVVYGDSIDALRVQRA